MNTHQNAAGGAVSLERLEQASADAKKTLESLKQALLLSDSASIFGSSLAVRLRDGSDKPWQRKFPAMAEGLDHVAQARDSLSAMAAQLGMGEEAQA